MPDFQDLDATVPIVIEDTNRAVFAYEINVAIGTADKLAVVGQVSNFDVGKIDVFFQN